MMTARSTRCCCTSSPACSTRRPTCSPRRHRTRSTRCCGRRRGGPRCRASRSVTGTFTYAKLPMVRDLQAAGELLADSDVVAAIAGDPEAQELLGSDPDGGADEAARGGEGGGSLAPVLASPHHASSIHAAPPPHPTPT